MDLSKAKVRLSYSPSMLTTIDDIVELCRFMGVYKDEHLPKIELSRHDMTSLKQEWDESFTFYEEKTDEFKYRATTIVRAVDHYDNVT